MTPTIVPGSQPTSPSRRHHRGPLLAVLAVLSTMLVACAERPQGLPEEPPAEPAPLRLSILHCGELVLADPAPFNITTEEAGRLDMVVPCYLIEHPDGTLLWDLGLPFGVQTGEYKMEGAEVRLERTVEEQLAERGLTPADIDYVAMSHLHFDHCGQANAFAGSHHLIQRAEHSAGFGEDGAAVAFFERQHYEALADSETTLLDGRHDVFGDGRVVIHPAPGHTPGHQVLFVDLEETGPVVLSGDLYHFAANRELQRAPVFNFDQEQTIASMQAVEQLLADTGAELWIQHDAGQAEERRWFPDSYR